MLCGFFNNVARNVKIPEAEICNFQDFIVRNEHISCSEISMDNFIFREKLLQIIKRIACYF